MSQATRTDPDSALLPALVAAEKIMNRVVIYLVEGDSRVWLRVGEFAVQIDQDEDGGEAAKMALLAFEAQHREAHALIQAALKQHNGEKV